MKAILLLNDGVVFEGEDFGSSGEVIGELILNTAGVGYQEMLTNPANAGKILVFTYPLIGNYGVAPKFNESKRVWTSGIVFKEKSRIFSNWQAKGSFEEFTKEHDLVGISGIDTRTLAVHIRDKGPFWGIISTQSSNRQELLNKIDAFRKKTLVSFLPKISVSKPAHLKSSAKKGAALAVLDLGITNSIIKQLQVMGFSLVLLPYNTSAQDILRQKVDGLIISDGPEEDPGLDEVVSNTKPLIGKLPILGIATGHQVLARALGCRIMKMKLGHRGVNYPVYSPPHYKGEITVQNHSWVVDADSLLKLKNIKVTAHNLNDRTIEEIESKKLRLIGTQYSPASPGFDEVNPVFNRFAKMLKEK